MTTKNDDEPERLDLKSLDIAEEKRRELLRLFPEVRTEGGKIDFDRLKRTLDETVDPGKERYGMNWPGKADCFRTIQAPSAATLRPMKEESVNWDTTENLIIEGDNLEVLKLLQKAYLGKVKMIYIDPPYNTGNDFIYPDNYSESLQTYLEYTGQVDSEGNKFGTNAETDGRFHSKWLNMMYPRLYLASNLLTPDGVIAISIRNSGHCSATRSLRILKIMLSSQGSWATSRITTSLRFSWISLVALVQRHTPSLISIVQTMAIVNSSLFNCHNRRAAMTSGLLRISPEGA